MTKRILWSFALLSVMVLAASGWSDSSAGVSKTAKAARARAAKPAATAAVAVAHPAKWAQACDPGSCPLPCASSCTEAAAASCPTSAGDCGNCGQ